jgi:hypothetical protein
MKLSTKQLAALETELTSNFTVCTTLERLSRVSLNNYVTLLNLFCAGLIDAKQLRALESANDKSKLLNEAIIKAHKEVILDRQ